MDVYYLNFYGLCTEEGEPSERGYNQIYFSESEISAVVDAIRWAAGRKKALPDLIERITCIKVGKYEIGQVDETGYCSTKSLPNYYEWKIDTSPRSLEEELEHMEAQLAKE